MEFKDTVEEVEVGTINGEPAIVALKGRCRAGDIKKPSIIKKAGMNQAFREALVESNIDHLVL